MSGTQQLVGAAGLGLVAVNAWTTQRVDFRGVFGDGDIGQAHKAAKEVGAELIGVAVLVLVAGASQGGAQAALAVLACLWLVWLMRRGGTTDSTSFSSTPIPKGRL